MSGRRAKALRSLARTAAAILTGDAALTGDRGYLSARYMRYYAADVVVPLSFSPSCSLVGWSAERCPPSLVRPAFRAVTRAVRNLAFERELERLLFDIGEGLR